LVQKTLDSSKFMVCSHRVGGFNLCGHFADRGSIFRDFADVLYGRLLTDTLKICTYVSPPHRDSAIPALPSRVGSKYEANFSRGPTIRYPTIAWDFCFFVAVHQSVAAGWRLFFSFATDFLLCSPPFSRLSFYFCLSAAMSTLTRLCTREVGY